MGERQTDEFLHPVQVEIFRRMAPEERARLSGELTRATWNRALEGIRRAHPALTEAQVLKMHVGLCYGAELAEAAYPLVPPAAPQGDPLVPPAAPQGDPGT